jgi:uncharacterized DUF497 family protein
MGYHEQNFESVGFDWDAGNFVKNWESHGVGFWECEEVFFNRPLLMSRDPKHSQIEERHFALGRTGRNRRLCIVFVMRRDRIRVISARDMNRREREVYRDEEQKTDS